jgi:hypothetical protein
MAAFISTAIFILFFYDRAKSGVHCIALFLVEKVLLNCTSAVVYRCFFLVFLFDRRKNATRAKSIIALDVLSHSPAALGTIFTSRAIIIHFLHLLHK